MICFSCDSDKEAAFFQEKFPCQYCDEDNIIEYNMCPDCGMMWRAINGVPQDESAIQGQDLVSFSDLLSGDDFGMLNPDDLSDDEKRIMENVTAHLEKVSKMDDGEASMSDYVHRCLQCGSTAVDVTDGLYKCTEDDCGFEWEVVKFE